MGDNLTNSAIRCSASSKVPACLDALPPMIILLHVAGDENVSIPTTGGATWRFPRREDAESTIEDPTIPSNLTNILVVNHCKPLKEIIITGNIMGDVDVGVITFEVFDITGTPIPGTPTLVAPVLPDTTTPVAFTTIKRFDSPLPANTPILTGFQHDGAGGGYSFTVRFLAVE